MTIHKFIGRLLPLAWCLCGAFSVFAQTTAFTYQGRLNDNNIAATGLYDLQFKLFDTQGIQLENTLIREDVQVTNGVFTVTLDFTEKPFTGADLFLEIAVRPGASNGPFTTLAPRQKFNATPYAMRSLLASTAENLTCQGCLNSTQIGSLPTGSTSYIQNTNATQANSNFNISGNGTASAFNALTEYRLNGARILSNPGFFNLFAGEGVAPTGQGNAVFGYVAGASNTSGIFNAFFGKAAGKDNTTGSRNTFVGDEAGSFNTTGGNNSFFGNGAGLHNLAGNYNTMIGDNAGLQNLASFNTFVGANAGSSNTTGTSNTYVGFEAGYIGTTGGLNTMVGTWAGRLSTGTANSFFGALAGEKNTLGSSNSFFGAQAGDNNTTGAFNSFFGRSAGDSNTTGNDNAFFGANAGRDNTTGSNNAFFGSLSGLLNTTGASNSFFGKGAGQTNTFGGSNSFFGFGAGKANQSGSSNTFVGAQAGENNVSAGSNSFFGSGAGLNNTLGHENSFFGAGAGGATTTGEFNSFFGGGAGLSNTTGSTNSMLGYLANVSDGNLNYATAIGAFAVVTGSNRVQLGRDGSDRVSIGLFQGGGSTHVCMLGSILGDCSSSRRYKENVQPLRAGLRLIQQLQPVTFVWKERLEADLGLIAEEVAEVEPLLVTHKKGVIEGVKYDQLTVVLINAVKEQQALLEAQQRELASLKQAFCAVRPQAKACPPRARRR